MKTHTFYDRISGVYDLLADAGEHRAREVGLQLLAASAGEQILEIGFGTGQALLALAEAVGEAGSVVGVDSSEGMLGVARRRLVDSTVQDRVSLDRAAVPPLAYDDEQFDAVFLSFTLELFPLTVIPDVLHEISRVLRVGGRVGIVSMATPQPGEVDSPIERSYRWMHRHFPHIVDCQPIEVEQFVRNAGYEFVEHQRIGLFTMPVAVVVAQRPGRLR